jgi:hypothetical protein
MPRRFFVIRLLVKSAVCLLSLNLAAKLLIGPEWQRCFCGYFGTSLTGNCFSCKLFIAFFVSHFGVRKLYAIVGLTEMHVGDQTEASFGDDIHNVVSHRPNRQSRMSMQTCIV